MLNALYQHPGATLTATFLFGMVAGLLLSVTIIQSYCISKRVITWQRQEAYKRTALRALEQGTIKIDESRMLCALCWEDRHPDEAWSFQRRTLCMEHLLQESKPVRPAKNYAEALPI